MYRSAGKNGGLRCQICTGCGLCPGVVSTQRAGGLHVLAEEALGDGAAFWESRDGEGYAPGEEAPSGGCPGGEAKAPGAVCVNAAGAVPAFGLVGDTSPLVVADVGTTTIAMLLYGRDGSVADRHVSVNPQTVYGADVLSRIRAAEDAGVREEMRGQVEGVLSRGLEKFRGKSAGGGALRMVLAANTTMTYLLMGWDVGELGHAPFAASRLGACETEISGVPCFIFPGLSAFVGGDIMAGIHACRMARREEITLLVDLGTNGEMVLGNRRRRIACATAAGPAFEGGANKGVWGADMVSLTAALLRENIMDETGLLVPEYFEKGIRIGNVHVTQEAVRGIQLAKAAIEAGIGILLDKYGITAREVDRVLLAGGFGYYLNPQEAAEIGLLPAALAGKTVAVGNTALRGGLLAGRELLAGGLPAGLAARLEKDAADTEIVNLALEAEFGHRYIRAMDFGRKDADEG